jgi:thymidylate synthase
MNHEMSRMMESTTEPYEAGYLKILDHLVKKARATGFQDRRNNSRCVSIPHVSMTYNMTEGKLPLLTTKRVPFKSVKVELEFFLKGLTDKKWLQDRKCTIWDSWCNPQKVTLTDDMSKEDRIAAQTAEMDLGPIYGAQWRDFNGQGIDQIAQIVKTLKENPADRRMVCSAWNPAQLDQMALPPCHMSFGLQYIDGMLHLHWTQRSADWFLGVPFNMASYALLLHLFCKQSGIPPGIVTGTFLDAHIYDNHLDAAEEQLSRKHDGFPFPRYLTTPLDGTFDIFNWTHNDTTIDGYSSHDKISAEVHV